MDLERFDELRKWKNHARSLAYCWFRHRFPEASHQKAWKFAGLAWTRFIRKKHIKRTEVKPKAGQELSPDDTTLPV